MNRPAHLSGAAYFITRHDNTVHRLPLAGNQLALIPLHIGSKRFQISEADSRSKTFRLTVIPRRNRGLTAQLFSTMLKSIGHLFAGGVFALPVMGNRGALNSGARRGPVKIDSSPPGFSLNSERPPSAIRREGLEGA